MHVQNVPVVNPNMVLIVFRFFVAYFYKVGLS